MAKRPRRQIVDTAERERIEAVRRRYAEAKRSGMTSQEAADYANGRDDAAAPAASMGIAGAGRPKEPATAVAASLIPYEDMPWPELKAKAEAAAPDIRVINSRHAISILRKAG